MYRALCMFTHDHLYLVRVRKSDHCSKESDNFWLIELDSYSPENVRKAILQDFPKVDENKCKISGISKVAFSRLESAGKQYVTIFVVVQVPNDQFKSFMPDQENWKWYMFSDISAMIASGKMTKCVLDVLKCVENGSLAPLSAIEEEAFDGAEVAKQLQEKELSDVQKILVLEAHFGMKELVLLYETFLSLVWPQTRMSFEKFCTFFDNVAFRSGDNLKNLFRAFDYRCEKVLSFADFVVGLAVIQPGTPHGPKSTGEQRTRYVFRYYCGESATSKRNACLSSEEFGAMLADVNRVKSTSKQRSPLIDPENQSIDSLDLKKFLTMVGTLKIRGTSSLLRLAESTIQRLRDSTAAMFVSTRKRPLDTTTTTATTESQTDEKRMKKEEDYSIAYHSVRLTQSGMVHHEPLINQSDSDVSQSSKLAFGASSQIIEDEDVVSVNHAKEMLNGLHYFEKPFDVRGKNGSERKAAYSWHKADKKGIAKGFIQLCQAVMPVLEGERRCLQLDAPAVVLGDIHGKYDDLMQFEARVWPLGLSLCSSRILLLGDFVDRGPHGFEVIAYLFAQKLMYPDKIFLLRGNHELRKTQHNHTFRKECDQKFGNHYGPQVWSVANDVFDRMPIAAVVDNKIFCVHGGVPEQHLYAGHSSITDAIESLPVCLHSDKIDENSLAWQVMWNDPLPCEMRMLTALDSNGFGANDKRGGAVRVFSADALERFLRAHGFSHMIRAHQVQEKGFKLEHSASLLTVFSSSYYCGMKNEASCVLVENHKLRVITIARNSL
uniref:Serine/threonine-protein phosphatase n=1 Tax=Plectus sambesii TaxID=2011161 RepID=A0A914W8B9_9BILA